MALPGIIGIGAGGHAKVVIETLRATGGVRIAGLLDARTALHGTRILDVPVLGGDDLLAKMRRRGVRRAFVGVGCVADMKPRRAVFERIRLAGLEVVTVIHPTAWVSPTATMGEGATVLAFALLNTGTALGCNVLVNSGALIEHDCVIGDHVHIATGATLAGGVRIGSNVHIGMGACIRQGITIGDDVCVGAGAVVVRDVPAGVTVAGVPARRLVRAARGRASR